LAGPLVAKRIIDVHISGIEQPWYQVEHQDSHTPSYKDAFYKREDRVTPDDSRLSEVRVLQVGKTFYMIPEAVESISGSRTINEQGELVISRGDDMAVYAAIPMTSREVYHFF